MKHRLIKLVLAAMLGVTLLPASASTLGYGTVRPRSTEDSTGGPSLMGTPPALPNIAPPPVGGGAALPGSHCGWIVIHEASGDISPSLPCNGNPIPMGYVYPCAPEQTSYSSNPDSACLGYVFTVVEGEGGPSTVMTAQFYPAIGPPTLTAVTNGRQVSLWNCPTAWTFTFLNFPDGKDEYTCVKN